MREAVIISTVRTGFGKAYKGVFNNTNDIKFSRISFGLEK